MSRKIEATSHISDEEIEEFQDKILEWYDKHGRHFPWRNKSASNYQRIISEVLLQRTKAETVAKFFPSFIKKYPSWSKLAEASEQELQETLKPLGLYKQRAKRLFKLAQELKSKRGRFSKKRADVEEMSMMGQYITNAYELFILNKPSPLLDVNMARVLERYFGQRKLADIRHDPYLQELAKRVVDHPRSKEINWGILDLGAKVCTSKKLLHGICPLKNNCSYYLVNS